MFVLNNIWVPVWMCSSEEMIERKRGSGKWLHLQMKSSALKPPAVLGEREGGERERLQQLQTSQRWRKNAMENQSAMSFSPKDPPPPHSSPVESHKKAEGSRGGNSTNYLGETWRGAGGECTRHTVSPKRERKRSNGKTTRFISTQWTSFISPLTHKFKLKKWMIWKGISLIQYSAVF